MSRLLEEYGRERFLKGYQEGFQEGYQEGKQKVDIEIATRMIVDNMPLEEIAEYVDLPLEKVEELAREVKKKITTPRKVWEETTTQGVGEKVFTTFLPSGSVKETEGGVCGEPQKRKKRKQPHESVGEIENKRKEECGEK